MYVAARRNELSLMTAVNSHIHTHIHTHILTYTHTHMNAQQQQTDAHTHTGARAFPIRAKMRSCHSNQRIIIFQ